jgi:hypothetical protein
LTIGFGVALVMALVVSGFGPGQALVGVTLSVASVPLLVLGARALVAPPPLAAALAYDRRLAMFERLSTAVAGSRADADVSDLQQRDALQALAGINAAVAFPYRVPRAELGILAVAATALVAGLLAANAGVIPGIGANQTASPLLSDSGIEPDASVPTLADPATLAQLEQIRAAMAELERQRDPDATMAALAADAAGEALRRTSEGRRLGRALDSGDFAAAAAEARELTGQLAGMNSTRLEELAEGLREASERAAAFDPGLADQMRTAADAMDRGQLADARSALERLAEEISAVGATVEADQALESQLDQLARQLAEAEGAAQGAVPAAEGDAPVSTAGGESVAAGQGEAGAEASAAASGGGDSFASGRGLEGTLETLAPEQRLNVDGELEIVEVEPTDEGVELIERPILELGSGGGTVFESSAGDRGFAVGRRDVARSVPLDMLPMMDRYFTSP